MHVDGAGRNRQVRSSTIRDIGTRVAFMIKIGATRRAAEKVGFAMQHYTVLVSLSLSLSLFLSFFLSVSPSLSHRRTGHRAQPEFRGAAKRRTRGGHRVDRVRARAAQRERQRKKETLKENEREREREKEGKKERRKERKKAGKKERKKERKKESRKERKKERKEKKREEKKRKKIKKERKTYIITGLLSPSCPLCWALWLGLVLFLSSSCPCLGRAPELCGWALWPGSVFGSCPPLVPLWPGLLERSVAEQIAMSMPTKVH